MLDEHQDIPSLAQHGVHVQEVDREDPGCLGVQELPPGRARAARRWIDARSMQDLPDGGRRDRHAELGQFAVDAAVSPQRILLRQADDEAADARSCSRAAGRAPLARVVLPATSLRCQASSAAGVIGKMAAQRLRGYVPCQRGEPQPVSRPVPDPAGVAAQHRVLVAAHEQLGILRQVAAGYQDSEAQYPATSR